MITRLPLDVLPQIGSFCSKEDISNLRSTCKELARTILPPRPPHPLRNGSLQEGYKTLNASIQGPIKTYFNLVKEIKDLEKPKFTTRVNQASEFLLAALSVIGIATAIFSSISIIYGCGVTPLTIGFLIFVNSSVLFESITSHILLFNNSLAARYQYMKKAINGIRSGIPEEDRSRKISALWTLKYHVEEHAPVLKKFYLDLRVLLDRHLYLEKPSPSRALQTELKKFLDYFEKLEKETTQPAAIMQAIADAIAEQ